MKTEKRKFIMSWTRFIVITAFLAFVNRMTSPDTLWIVWVLAGWGVAQILRTVDYFLAATDARDAQTAANGPQICKHA